MRGTLGEPNLENRNQERQEQIEDDCHQALGMSAASKLEGIRSGRSDSYGGEQDSDRRTFEMVVHTRRKVRLVQEVIVPSLAFRTVFSCGHCGSCSENPLSEPYPVKR